VTEEWLKRYRKNIKNLLSGNFFGIDNIFFMPEPFAVFQYYRYGYKHPLISSNKKKNVLVIDFGGGTFDVCVISTTKTGDVWKGGKYSKPLAATSEPIGGFFVNRVIVEALLFKYFDDKKIRTNIRRGIKEYNKWKKKEKGFKLSTLKKDYKIFITKFESLIYLVERYKIYLSNIIDDWSLDKNLNPAISFEIPKSMFDTTSETISVTLTSTLFRDIFIRDVWRAKLKNVISKTISRAKNELGDEDFSLILLSGGSSNIKWIKHLIKDEFLRDLEDAEIFDLPNYQEIVAKGLAIECARRFFNKEKDGDFSSVTYNRICLLLGVNDFPCEPKIFKIKTQGLPDCKNETAVLLPSSYVLKNNLNKELKWKVKLDKRPTKSLNYYFLKSTLDYNDLDNLFNLQENKIFTKDIRKFDSYVTISLVVNENGTATPKFIFKTEKGDQVISYVTGKPFPIDVTCAQENPSTSYIGFDFGTSNSSVSYIDQKSISTFQKRSDNEGWCDLSDLIEKLPYPISCSLAHYLCQIDQDRKVSYAMKFVENALSFITYIAYLEKNSFGNNRQKIFRNFSKRSAGPLWGMLQTILRSLKPSFVFSNKFEILKKEINLLNINMFIETINNFKHDKIDINEVNTDLMVQTIANICAKSLKDLCFGYFEGVKKQRFSSNYHGLFRIAHGKQPFTSCIEYNDIYEFSEEISVIIDTKTRRLMKLTPLIFWEYCKDHKDQQNGHCYFFDKVSSTGEVIYTAINYPCCIAASKNNEYSGIHNTITKMKENDIEHNILTLNDLFIKNP
jgi:hypothetical protein